MQPPQPESRNSTSVAPILVLVGALVLIGGFLFFKNEGEADKAVSDAFFERNVGTPEHARPDAPAARGGAGDKSAATGAGKSLLSGTAGGAKTAANAGNSGSGGQSATPAKRKLSGIAGTGPRLTLAASNVTRATVDTQKEPWKMREDRMEIRESLSAVGTRIRAGEAPPAEIVFPLYDGESVTLANVRFKPQKADVAGVFLADVVGADGAVSPFSHASLSYYNNSLVGSIHTGDGREFDIRCVNPAVEAVPAGANVVYVTQCDPAKRPGCGTCMAAREKVLKSSLNTGTGGGTSAQ
ncbi:MAG: hypothetical protein LBR07_01835 [Puniceicoccales bacterium]|jgi:hypothetical protein|nr:hypothetical protein [Puniceicoccales bacterium]